MNIFIVVVLICRITVRRRADGPAGDPFDVAFDPPTVQHAEVRHAVEGSLHTTGSRSLQGAHGIVEPKIDAGDQQTGDLHIVIFQINDLDLAPQLFNFTDNSVNDLLAWLIVGMGLAGK